MNPPKVVQFRRGTTAENESFRGAEGELTVDLEKKTLVVHDGVRLGGFPLERADTPNVRYLTFRAGVVQQGIASLGFSAPENSPTAIAISYNDLILGAAAFAPGTGQNIQDYIVLPTNWLNPIGLDLLWHTTATSGVVNWKFETCSDTPGSVFGSGIFTNPISVSGTTSTTPDELLISSVNDIQVATFVGTGNVFFRLTRLPSDTAAANANLVALRFRIPVTS